MNKEFEKIINLLESKDHESKILGLKLLKYSFFYLNAKDCPIQNDAFPGCTFEHYLMHMGEELVHSDLYWSIFISSLKNKYKKL